MASTSQPYQSDSSSDEEDAFVLFNLLAPPPEVLQLVLGSSGAVDVPKTDARKGSVKGRRTSRYRSTEWYDNLERLDATQWRRNFRMSRKAVTWLVRRLHDRLFKPGTNKRGTLSI